MEQNQQETATSVEQKEISHFNYAKLSFELKEYSTATSSLDKFMTNYPNSTYYAEAKSLWISSLAYSNNFIQAYEAYDKINQPGIDLLKIYPNIVYGRACLYLSNRHQRLQQRRDIVGKLAKFSFQQTTH